MKKEPNILDYMDNQTSPNQSKSQDKFVLLALNEKIIEMKDELLELINQRPNIIPFILAHPDKRVTEQITNSLLKLMVQKTPDCIPLILATQNQYIKAKVNYYLLKCMISASITTIPLLFNSPDLIVQVNTFLLDHMIQTHGDTAINYILESNSQTILQHVNRHRVAQILKIRPDYAQKMAEHSTPCIKDAYQEYCRKLQKQQNEALNMPVEDVQGQTRCVLF